jgi:hypothetical protein
VGALDADLRTILANRKEEVLALVQAEALTSSPAAIAQGKPGAVQTAILPIIHREIPPPMILERHERMIHFAQELRRCGYHLANCAQRMDVFPRIGVNFWREMRPNWTPRIEDRSTI